MSENILDWEHSYFGSTRRYTILFGSLFKGLKIARRDKNKTTYIELPVVQAVGKMYSKLDDVQDREYNRVANVLPIMTYNLVNIEYEASRQTNQNLKVIKRLGNANGTVNTQFNRLPYVFNFDLNVKTKNYDELLQVVEQIAPTFQNGLVITIEDIPSTEIDVEADIRVTLNDFEIINEFDGPLDTTKSICEAVFHFRLTGNMYNRTKAEYQNKQIVVKAQILDDERLVQVADVRAEDIIPGTITETFANTTETLFGAMKDDK